MNKPSHTQDELVSEIESLRSRVTELENLLSARDHLDDPAQPGTQLVEKSVERRLAEDTARKSEELYRRIFDTAADGLFLVGQDGKISHANQAASEIFGYSPEEMVGFDVVRLIHPDDRCLFGQVYQQILAGGGAHVEATNLHKDGSEIAVELRASMLEFYDMKQALCIVRDLTARKKAEQAVAEEQRHLRRLLEMHEHDRQLVAYEIHDGFVQSLVGARMLLDLPRRHVAPEMLAPFEKAVKLIDQGIDEARRLISGQRPLILDERGLMAAIEHLVCEHQDDGPRVVYQDLVSFQRLVPPLETAVFRVVQEGLNNARRHSGSPQVDLQVTQTGDRLRVEIQDWGVGFDPEDISQRCFGLEGIRERARLFGGTANIQSTPGVGTTVAVEFPVVAMAQEDGK